MTPKNSIPLGRAFGIPVVLSQFLVMLVGLGMFVALLNGISPIAVLLYVTVVMGIVLLHELGHSLTARHFGVHVSHITLWPLGGVAWMGELPRDSRIEGLVALAGPAVNLALAALASPLLLSSGTLYLVAERFVLINLMLGGFNLLPAFPMDGGRVLRAYLARRGDWLGATERAVSIGRGFAFVLGFGGLFTGNFSLPFIAVFLWLMGQRELFSMRVRELGADWPFGGFAAAAGGDPRTAWSGRAPAGPQRPTPPEGGPATSGASSRGFSPEDLERLERDHGRLRRDWNT
jgi:Zn-dependent protease